MSVERVPNEGTVPGSMVVFRTKRYLRVGFKFSPENLLDLDYMLLDSVNLPELDGDVAIFECVYGGLEVVVIHPVHGRLLVSNKAVRVIP